MIDTIWNFLGIAGTILKYTWPLLILAWIIGAKVLWKRWPVDVVIIEKRGSNLIKTNDRAGKFTDPYSGTIGYRLRKSKDTIQVANYDWILHNVAVHTTILDRLVNLIRGNLGTLFLFRYGSKQYKPIRITENKLSRIVYKEVADEKGNPIWITVYQPIDPRDKMGALEFEVVDWDNMNFMVQEQRASVIRRTKKGDWVKATLIPLSMMVVTALICIIAIKLSFDFASSVKTTPLAKPNIPAEVPKIPIIGNIIPGA